MNDRDVAAAIERMRATAETIETAREGLQAAMTGVLPVIGVKGLICMVAGIQFGVIERYLKKAVDHG